VDGFGGRNLNEAALDARHEAHVATWRSFD